MPSASSPIRLDINPAPENDESPISPRSKFILDAIQAEACASMKVAYGIKQKNAQKQRNIDLNDEIASNYDNINAEYRRVGEASRTLRKMGESGKIPVKHLQKALKIISIALANAESPDAKPNQLYRNGKGKGTDEDDEEGEK